MTSGIQRAAFNTALPPSATPNPPESPLIAGPSDTVSGGAFRTSRYSSARSPPTRRPPSNDSSGTVRERPCLVSRCGRGAEHGPSTFAGRGKCPSNIPKGAPDPYARRLRSPSHRGRQPDSLVRVDEPRTDRHGALEDDSAALRPPDCGIIPRPGAAPTAGRIPDVSALADNELLALFLSGSRAPPRPRTRPRDARRGRGTSPIPRPPEGAALRVAGVLVLVQQAGQKVGFPSHGNRSSKG